MNFRPLIEGISHPHAVAGREQKSNKVHLNAFMHLLQAMQCRQRTRVSNVIRTMLEELLFFLRLAHREVLGLLAVTCKRNVHQC